MSPTGDMTFGSNGANFFVNQPAGVAQLADTRLNLWAGNWFLDLTEGTPYDLILGKSTQSYYDSALLARLNGTTGVVAVQAYQSQLTARNLAYSATLYTAYGSTTVGQVTGNVPVPA